jgi:4-amino-4-deoxy-L-arabinose transferase-like glycosyltransferase
MATPTRDFVITLVIACFAGFLFIPLALSVPLFEGEELRCAEIAREMLLTGDYYRTHLDFQPSWEQPPIFFWLQAASMRAFGANSFAARAPNVLLGMLVLPLLFHLGKCLHSRSLGVLWAMCYGCSLLPILLSASSLPNPLSNALVVFALAFVASYYAPSKGKVHAMRRVALAGVLLGAAVLVEGFSVLMLMGAVWLMFWFVRRREVPFPITELAVLLAIALGISFVWFGAEIVRRGLPFFREFAVYHVRLLTSLEKSSSMPIWYYLAFLLLGCFPASTLVFPAFAKHPADDVPLHTFKTWMILLLVLVVCICIVIQPQIPDYSSLAAFPCSFLAAHTLMGLLRRKHVMTSFTKVFCIALGVVWSFVLFAIPLVGMNTSWILALTDDVFVRSTLTANVQWSAWELCIGAGFGLIVVVVSIFLLRGNYFEWMITLFPASALAFVVVASVIAPKIEQYAHGAEREFYQSLQGKEVYIATLDFTSFGSLFYAQKQRSQSAAALNIPPEDFATWLLEGQQVKPAYFVCKAHHAAIWRKHPHLTEMYTRNGFVFFQRQPLKPAPLDNLTLCKPLD